MKIKIISMLSTALLLAFAVTLLGTDASAQKDKSKGKRAKSVEINSAKGDTGTKGGDKNVTQAEMANDPAAKSTAPAAKGGSKGAKGGGCRVELDNSTPWFIKIYVDGSFRGTMDPWGDSYVHVLPGITKVYARAEFTDGTYRYWGPSVANCGNYDIFPFRMVP